MELRQVYLKQRGLVIDFPVSTAAHACISAGTSILAGVSTGPPPPPPRSAGRNPATLGFEVSDLFECHEA